MKIVIGATGASGSIYLQRLLEQINASEHEVHLVMTVHARQVADHELLTFRLPPKVLQHPDNDMNVPFVSGSARFDAMVIVPSSMSTLGRIATGSGQGALLRAADVFLKERRKLIVVPRETPWSLIQARNVVTLIEAGAIVLPAIPSFYSGPKNVNEIADTVVWRILDQLGLPSPQAFRWQSEKARRLKIRSSIRKVSLRGFWSHSGFACFRSGRAPFVLKWRIAERFCRLRSRKGSLARPGIIGFSCFPSPFAALFLNAKARPSSAPAVMALGWPTWCTGLASRSFAGPVRAKARPPCCSWPTSSRQVTMSSLLQMVRVVRHIARAAGSFCSRKKPARA
jgi:4-hydroxy-3-polyprenylbenzoate decarboxylase